ncbi:MAG TPA: hypothetical protein VJ302_26285 [Blastocatellia bacterium]|nr:hypothetical protein [Blastocatellia bacterium]
MANILRLNLTMYPGGVAIWGALKPVYDTTGTPVEMGVHVHARMTTYGQKVIDDTFSLVIVEYSIDGTASELAITGEDAALYNVSRILRRKVRCARCPACGGLHRDQDWLAVHHHQQHHCESCGEKFTDLEPGISNPVILLAAAAGDLHRDRQATVPARRRLARSQAQFPGGIQIWGSNPALLWTVERPEEAGIHFHGFYDSDQGPNIDETFGTLALDDMILDAEMVRVLMAQQALPCLSTALCSLVCPHCDRPHFDTDEWAITPHSTHVCGFCGAIFYDPDDRRSVSNPVLAQLAQLRINVEGKRKE